MKDADDKEYKLLFEHVVDFNYISNIINDEVDINVIK